MNFKNIFIYILSFSLSYINAQQNKKPLFTVVDEPVSTDEFMKVFNKNRDIVAEENKKSIEEYLELYINYKLKLKQAYDLKYDTVSTYKKELSTYKEQLMVPYLTDGKVTNSLVREAYDRTKTEVNASHILIRLQPKASPVDTLQAYQKIIEARGKILGGASFETIAKEYSQDPSAKQNGGSLGYFSAFAMVYSFENAVYSTEVNKVSMPFKTRFGYHIVKVNDKRDSKGEVEVAHIMIKEKKEDSLYASTKINELHAKLNQNGNFELLAKLHSDDRNSSINGGKLAKFGTTKMIKSFADVAFSLKNANEISKPFKTPYGWHIIKLIKKHPVKEFDEMKGALTQKIEKSERASIAGKSVVKRLTNEYKIIKNNVILKSFFKNDTAAISRNLKNMIFSINGVQTTLIELVKYNTSQPNKTAKQAYTNLFESKVLDYYKENLEETNPDFAFIFQEYKDGLLLFDILQDKIWKRAENDTLMLKEFFAKNQANYYWKKRGDILIASCTQKDKAVLVKKYLKEGKAPEEIKKLVNEGATIHVIFTKGIFEEGHKKLPKKFVLDTVGVSAIFNDEDRSFSIVKVNEVIPPQPKEFNNAKGIVINDFQNHLEQEWIKELKQQYPVKVNKRVLKKIVKQNKH